MEWLLAGAVVVVIILLLFIWVLLGFVFGLTNLYGQKQETCFDSFIMWPMNKIVKILGKK